MHILSYHPVLQDTLKTKEIQRVEREGDRIKIHRIKMLRPFDLILYLKGDRWGKNYYSSYSYYFFPTLLLSPPISLMQMEVDGRQERERQRDRESTKKESE